MIELYAAGNLHMREHRLRIETPTRNHAHIGASFGVVTIANIWPFAACALMIGETSDKNFSIKSGSASNPTSSPLSHVDVSWKNWSIGGG